MLHAISCLLFVVGMLRLLFVVGYWLLAVGCLFFVFLLFSVCRRALFVGCSLFDVCRLMLGIGWLWFVVVRFAVAV